MRFLYTFFAVVTLAACTASVGSMTSEPTEILRDLALQQPEEDIPLTESGTTYIGKFATVSALNSGRSFVSDYHGEVRFTFFKNRLVECHFWVEGRITDPMVYDGINGFVEAYSTLCSGKLQRDGSFEFQGAYMEEGPHVETDAASDFSGETYTVRGSLKGEVLAGELMLGSVFRNDLTLISENAAPTTESGIAFEAFEMR